MRLEAWTTLSTSCVCYSDVQPTKKTKWNVSKHS